MLASYPKRLGLISLALLLILGCRALNAATGNQTIDSFNKAKKTLMREVYHDHRTSFYCEATFDAKKNVTLPEGFTTTKHIKRAKRIEWEHVVPAQNFGRAFKEWREGHSSCVSSKGKTFKGRRCAEKMNMEYRYMQSDMYNLVPAVGAVNAMRSNYNFRPLPEEASDFGSCPMKIEDRKAEPPPASRGVIARTYQYMQATYPRYKMSRQQQQLMEAWSKNFPVTSFECVKTKRIESIQRNSNQIVKGQCQQADLW